DRQYRGACRVLRIDEDRGLAIDALHHDRTVQLVAVFAVFAVDEARQRRIVGRRDADVDVLATDQRAVGSALDDRDFGLGRIAVLDRLVTPHVDRQRGAGRLQRERAALRLGERAAVTAAAAAAGQGEAGEQQPQGLAEKFHVVSPGLLVLGTRCR